MPDRINPYETISIDDVLSDLVLSWSKKPETWNIKPMVKQGFILGLLLTAEALVWLFIGKKYFEISDLDHLHSFGFASLFFASIFNIFVIRTPTRFYKQPIGRNLLFAIIVDIILACIIISIGFPGFTTLPIVVTISSILYFATCSFTINDWVKLKVTH